MTPTLTDRDQAAWEPARPLARLDLYDEAVVLTKFRDGGTITHPVALEEVAAAFAEVPIGTGVLPANTLFWGRQQGQIVLGLYLPARSWAVTVGPDCWCVPWPPLVFVGLGTSYRVYAVKQRPPTPQAPLYQAPCPNVYPDGRICPGTTPFPVCATATIQAAFQCFISSGFNRDLGLGKCQSQPNDILALWAQLQGRKRFPLAELVPSSVTLSNLARQS
jgi:PRTRC genetic system protein B